MHWALTPDGKFHESDDWGSLPKEVVHCGTVGQGPANPDEFYRLSHGRAIGFSTPNRQARMLGVSLDEYLASPDVKLGTDVPNYDDMTKRMVAFVKAKECPKCPSA